MNLCNAGGMDTACPFHRLNKSFVFQRGAEYRPQCPSFVFGCIGVDLESVASTGTYALNREAILSSRSERKV